MNYKNDLFFVVFLLIHSSNSLMINYLNRKFCCRVFKKSQNQKTNNSISDSYKYLENVKYDNTILFIPPVLYGKVVKVYDGDTITIASKLPFEDSPVYRFRVRLRDIDSPEIKGHTNTEKNLAIIARDALHDKIFDKIVRIENRGTEKWGRLLADIYCNDTHINKWMLENGYAVCYDGGTKNRPKEWDE
jgi:hypothetical protein